MNIFNFNINEAIEGIYSFFLIGLGFGVLVVGFLRFALLSVFERHEA